MNISIRIISLFISLYSFCHGGLISGFSIRNQSDKTKILEILYGDSKMKVEVAPTKSVVFYREEKEQLKIKVLINNDKLSTKYESAWMSYTIDKSDFIHAVYHGDPTINLATKKEFHNSVLFMETRSTDFLISVLN